MRASLMPGLFLTATSGCSFFRDTYSVDLFDSLGVEATSGADVRTACAAKQGGGLATTRLFFTVDFTTNERALDWVGGLGLEEVPTDHGQGVPWWETTGEEQRSRVRCNWEPPRDPPIPVVFRGTRLGNVAGVSAVVVDSSVWGRGWIVQ